MQEECQGPAQQKAVTKGTDEGQEGLPCSPTGIS